MWRSQLGLTASVAPMVAALVMAAATPSLGAEPARPPPATAPPGKDANLKDKPICTSEVPMGSLMPKRVCRTQAQINEDRRTVEDIKKERQGSGAYLIGDRSLNPGDVQQNGR